MNVEGPPPPEQGSGPPPDRSSTYVLAGIGAVVVTALLVGLLVSRRKAPDQPAGSPEATVQAYFRALHDVDTDAMAATFSDDLAERCRPRLSDFDMLRASRVTLREVGIAGETAFVRVAISQDYGGGLFDGGTSAFDDTIRLKRAGDGWRIDTTPWPYLCGPDSGPKAVPS